MLTKSELERMLRPEQVAYDVEVNSKKRALEVLSELLAAGDPEITAHEVLDSLLARERLGATGLGNGVAVPHGRLKGSKEIKAAFLRLKGDIAFGSVDNQPVDLLFALLVPEDSSASNVRYLQVLAYLAEMFSDQTLRESMRGARSREELFGIITGWQPAC
jgi:PTS system nitrogen regulatory IIA component